jgi:hypothetical protein
MRCSFTWGLAAKQIDAGSWPSEHLLLVPRAGLSEVAMKHMKTHEWPEQKNSDDLNRRQKNYEWNEIASKVFSIERALCCRSYREEKLVRCELKSLVCLTVKATIHEPINPATHHPCKLSHREALLELNPHMIQWIPSA